MSGASERANGRASGPVLQSVFLAVIDHSALSLSVLSLPLFCPSQPVPLILSMSSACPQSIPHLSLSCSLCPQPIPLSSAYPPCPQPVPHLFSACPPFCPQPFPPVLSLSLICSQPVLPPVLSLSPICPKPVLPFVLSLSSLLSSAYPLFVLSLSPLLFFSACPLLSSACFPYLQPARFRPQSPSPRHSFSFFLPFPLNKKT